MSTLHRNEILAPRAGSDLWTSISPSVRLLPSLHRCLLTAYLKCGSFLPTCTATILSQDHSPYMTSFCSQPLARIEDLSKEFGYTRQDSLILLKEGKRW